jgi:hypothetical protein
MLSILEKIGARMLDLVVPTVVANAGNTICEPGHCWCRGKAEWNEICCCNDSGTAMSCWCDAVAC